MIKIFEQLNCLNCFIFQLNKTCCYSVLHYLGYFTFIHLFSHKCKNLKNTATQISQKLKNYLRQRKHLTHLKLKKL
jgi:hypothetical protein